MLQTTLKLPILTLTIFENNKTNDREVVGGGDGKSVHSRKIKHLSNTKNSKNLAKSRKSDHTIKVKIIESFFKTAFFILQARLAFT